MYTLRSYQKSAVDAAIYGLTRYKKPFIIQAATGAGKSLIIAEICHRLDVPILILQPSKEILEQNYQKLLSYDPLINAGIYSASKNKKEVARFTFATIGSIYKKPELFQHFKYVIIDECHGVDPKNINGMLISFLKAIGTTSVCGLTATPYRIVQKYYTDDWGALWYTAHLKMINRIHKAFFKKILYKIETPELIQQGYLAPIKYYADDVNIAGLKPNSTGRDFTDSSVDNFWNDNRIRRISEAVEFADKHHKKSLIFCSSLKQARRALEAAQYLGVGAALVSGETPKKEREQIIADYRAGKIKHIFNVGVFTTGFDVPELDCIILARTTMSLALYYQMVGRGVRIDPETPNKVLHVYDLCGVVERLGRVEAIRIKTEQGGFKDEVWTDYGRVDEEPLFNWFVKKKPKHLS